MNIKGHYQKNEEEEEEGDEETWIHERDEERIGIGFYVVEATEDHVYIYIGTPSRRGTLAIFRSSSR